MTKLQLRLKTPWFIVLPILLLMVYYQRLHSPHPERLVRAAPQHLHSSPLLLPTTALCSKSNGSYDIKDSETLPLIFSTSKYFRWKFQPCPSFFSHANIPDKLKRKKNYVHFDPNKFMWNIRMRIK